MLELKFRNTIAMANENDELDERLKCLMAKACFASPGSPLRKQYLTQVVELVQRSNRLHRYSSHCYPEALQETWCMVLQKPENYTPERGGVIKWINSILHYRLLDEIKKTSNPPRIFTTGESYNSLLENIPARPEVPSMIEETLHWINTDPTKILRQTHLPHRPDVNAQLLLSERFPPQTKWDLLTEKLKVPRSTLAMFYKRQCLPLLRGFGGDQGYL